MRRTGLASLLVVAAGWLHAQSPTPIPIARQFEEAVTLVDSRNDCAQAVPIFERVAASTDRGLAARALVYLGGCYERLGNERARQTYRRVIEQFPEQRAAAAQARARLAALDRSRGTRRLTLRRLWSEGPSGLDIYGRPSIDGRVLPMTDGQGRLVLTDLELRNRRPPVALGASSDGLPACTMDGEVVLSPDAQWAAFCCEVRDTEYELRVVRTDAAGPRQRRLSREYLEPLEWSLPSRVLVQRGSDELRSLAMVNVTSGELRDVTTLQAPVDAAAVSPDGAWVAFDGPDPSNRHDVFLVPSRGGAPVAIGTGASDDLLPGWTPDGRGVVFISDRTGSPGLWLQAVAQGRATGSAQLLSQDLGRVADVWAATRGGAYIYFRQTGLVSVALAMLDSLGQPAGAPSTSGGGQYGGTMMPTWSPGGRRLAYQVTLTGARTLALGVREVESGEERLVRTGLRHFVRPRWSPDGRHIAVRGRDLAGRYGIHVIDPDSGHTAPVKIMLRVEENRLGLFQWTPGGDLVVRVGSALFRVDVVSGAEQHVLDVPEGTYAFDVSPVDGALAFLRNESPRGDTVIVVRTPDGVVHEPQRIEATVLIRDLVWTHDGRSLLFTRTPRNPSLRGEAAWPAAWRVEVATGEARALGLSMDRLRDMSVSPDGRRLAFTTGAPLREPWIVENHLPTPSGGQRRP